MARLPIQDLDHTLEQGGDAWQALAGSRLFITGGTGFVGKWLVESLLWADQRLNLQVSATVLTRDPDRFRAESPHLAGHPAVTLLKGNVQNFDFPAGDFPFVIHAATERHFEPDVRRPLSTFDLDLEGTRRVLEFARAHGARRLLFTSSGAVYGKQPPELTHIPEDYPGAPLTTDTGSPYGQAKRASEFLCAMYARQHQFAVLIARLFAFAGPCLPLDQNFAVGNFIRDALAGGPIQVKGDGTTCRSYLYAADLAVWLWQILLHGTSCRPYNVGSGQSVTIAELAGTVAELASPRGSIDIAQKSTPGAPPSRYVPCVARAERELGLRPLIGFEQGVQRMYEWAREQEIISSTNSTSGQSQIQPAAQ
jgi:nucleoside-diphosphate-sugar epimerase